MNSSRILIAGLRGGSGKTLATLGLIAAWRLRGRSVAPFKKGPDYIDAAWMSAAADQPCRNLDSFLMSPQTIVRSFASAASTAEVAVIEGNRGLFDGMDADGTHSTAELAKLLHTPVVLVVDSTKTTRTAAAMVLGCQRLDPQVPLSGVILNRTAGERHESVLRNAIEQTCELPVLGAIPRLGEALFPERHMGLVPPQEHEARTDAMQRVAAVAEQHLDLDALWNVAARATVHDLSIRDTAAAPESKPEVVRIGIFRDEAFQFYYPENLEALSREGARLIEISPIHDVELPAVDALYIGGGFPETLAAGLASNTRFIDSVRQAVESDLPVYAECGGAAYLGEQLVFNDSSHRMAAVFPVTFGFQKKPKGHGYTMLETVGANPYFALGDSLRGHEFHYTYLQSSAKENLRFAFRVSRGHGFDGEHDGLCHRNVLACYTHVHALGTENWAPALVRAATRFKTCRSTAH